MSGKWTSWAIAATLVVAGGGLGLAATGHLPGAHPTPTLDPHAGLVMTATPTPVAQPTGKQLWTCPMHPQIIQDHPGTCPICHMDLVKKAAPAVAAPAASSAEFPDVAGVTLSPRQRVLANVAVAPVTRKVLAAGTQLDGRITFDETRLHQISAWVGGRLDRVYGGATGTVIGRGTVMATVYSPDLVAAQQEYLAALAGERELARAPYPDVASGARDVAKAARQRLELLGVSVGQIARLEATRHPLTEFPVLAPDGGLVIARKARQGQYVSTGDVLFELADLDRVWVEASAFEADLARVHPGQRAEVRPTAYPGRALEGHVAAILPALDPATRTAKIRVELANPGGLLRPDMYATVRLEQMATARLAVPGSAVIDTGRHTLVYVEAAPNRFEPRMVTLGPRAGDDYPVLSGLKEGEKVAVSGGFLLDASAQLQAPEGGDAMKNMPGMGSPGP